ncbi:MAG: hypothetical protein LBT30_07545 [Clostridiales bacterium]|jgi:hypothetical protein|nr:hypothetical protein [Clostridiales bacterium]
MSNKIKIVIASVLVVLIAGVGVFVYFNRDNIQIVSASSVGYTEADIRASYQRGYEESIGDIEYYRLLCEELQERLIYERGQAEARYDNMVAYYDSVITRLNGEIDRLIEYITALESYIIDLGFDISLPDDLAFLQLRLGVYQIIKGRLESEIIYYQGELSAVASLPEKQAELSAAIADVGLYGGLLASPVVFQNTVDYIGSTNRGDFGGTLSLAQFTFAREQLYKIGWKDGYGRPSTLSWLQEYLGAGAMAHFTCPNGSATNGLTTLAYLNLADYYYYAILVWNDSLVQRAVWQNALNAAIISRDLLQPVVTDYSVRKAIADYVIGINTEKLIIVNQEIASIQAQINNL